MITDLYKQGNYAAVLQAAQQQGVDPQTSPIEAMVVAASHLELGHLDQALQLCRNLEPLLGQRLEYRRLFASCLRRSGDLREAEALYRQTIQAFPDDLGLRCNFANLLTDLNELYEAKAMLQEVLIRDPSHIHARANLLTLEAKVSQVNSLEQAGRSTPSQSHSEGHTSPRSNDDSFSLDPLAMAFSEAEVEEDQRIRQEHLKQKAPPSMPQLPPLAEEELAEELMAAARHALNDQNTDVALEFAKEILTGDNAIRHADAYNLIGDTYMQLRQYANAETCFLTGLELGAEMMSLHINLTSLACLRHDCHLARRRLAAAIDYGITEHHQQQLLKQIEKLEGVGQPLSLSGKGLFPQP